MNGPDELDQEIAADLRRLTEVIRRRQAYLTDDILHADVGRDLAEALRLLERAADTLLSVE